MLQVYTGEGKGKTSAAIGAAIRALGRGWRVLLIQFFKPAPSGEIQALACFAPLLEVMRSKVQHPFFSKEKKETAQTRLKDEWSNMLSHIETGKWDMLILDEMNVVLTDAFLTWEEVSPVLRFLPEKEIIFTGRGIITPLERKADLITEMLKVKHPYDRGLPEREGIEY
ncbi:MAG: cob(I)yrinic acid a,c-diamide adenosyltransferase [Caldiserica bacterium]|nr:cob(I)yrinic acid a,c-diamide adenosyltransferase [Caldisericota bacterium]